MRRDAHVYRLSRFSVCLMFALLVSPVMAIAQETPGDTPGDNSILDNAKRQTATIAKQVGAQLLPGNGSLERLPDISSRENFSAAMQIIILLTVLSLAPAILIMMTSFTRIIIVLSLLRQALGTQQLPPNQILMGLALFMTFIVMGPTWQRINNEALQPYMDGKIEQPEALANAQVPLREFMIRQI